MNSLPAADPETGFPPARRHSAALAARGLACRRGDRLLFEGLDFDLPAGGALWLTGPNGAGKTSLLRILAGLLAPGAGRILIDGVEKTAEERALETLFLGLRDALKPTLQVREAMALHAAMLSGRTPDSATLDAALDRFGLGRMAELPCGWLSTGQRRRVSLARHMLAGTTRPLWLLDEPANGLDAHAEALLADLAAEHRARGGLIIVASHQALGWPGMAQVAMADLAGAWPA